MSMRCLWLIWSLLTWLAAILCTVGCLLPYWLKGHVHLFRPTLNVISSSLDASTSEDTYLDRTPLWKSDANRFDTKAGLTTNLGLFRRCGYPVYVNRTASEFNTIANVQTKMAQPVMWHSGCGHYSQLTSGPHIAWHIAFFSLVSACGLLFFATFFLFILGFALYLISIRTIYRSCQIMLLIAGLLTLISCVLYPVGWNDNSEVRQACGEEAYALNLGRCHIGWAYVLTCSGGLLSLFAALLPVIFPTSAGQQTGSTQSNDLFMEKSELSSTCCPCFGKSKRQMKSLTDASIPFFSGPVPSPANSLDAESVCFQAPSQRPESILLLPRPGGLSPTSSTSPVPSVLQDRGHFMKHEDMGGMCLVPTSSQHPPSAFLPSSSVPQYPYLCSYVPNQQRYSTGHYQLLPTNLLASNLLHTNQRISVAVNADPLIYVSEEEELLDIGEPQTDKVPGSAAQRNEGRESKMNGQMEGTSCEIELATRLQEASSSPCPMVSTSSTLADVCQTHSDPFLNRSCVQQMHQKPVTGTLHHLVMATEAVTQNQASCIV